MAVEEKWKANQEKVAFMKQFPGLLGSWEALIGKSIETVIMLKGKQGAAAIIFNDGTFTVAPPWQRNRTNWARPSAWPERS